MSVLHEFSRHLNTILIHFYWFSLLESVPIFPALLSRVSRKLVIWFCRSSADWLPLYTGSGCGEFLNRLLSVLYLFFFCLLVLYFHVAPFAGIHPSIYLSVYLSIYLSVCLSVCLSIDRSKSSPLSPGFCACRPYDTICCELDLFSVFFVSCRLIVWKDEINGSGWCLEGESECWLKGLHKIPRVRREGTLTQGPQKIARVSWIYFFFNLNFFLLIKTIDIIQYRNFK